MFSLFEEKNSIFEPSLELYFVGYAAVIEFMRRSENYLPLKIIRLLEDSKNVLNVYCHSQVMS